MCLDGPQRGHPPPCLGHLGCLALPPQEQLPRVMSPHPWSAGFRGRLHLQKEGSFFSLISKIRCHSWEQRAELIRLIERPWIALIERIPPSCSRQIVQREITSALNSFSPSLNFTPISGWRGSEQTCDTGVVQFSFAGSKVSFLLFGFWCGVVVFFFFPF